VGLLGGGADGTGGLKVGSSDITKEFSEDYSKIDDRQQKDDETRGIGPVEDADSVDLGDRDKTVHPLSYDPEELYKDAKWYKIEKDTAGNWSQIPWGEGPALASERTLSDVDTLTKTITNATLSTATLSVSDFNLVINALKANGDVEIISNPTILTLHNHEASILIGEKYPIIQSETSEVGFTTESLDHYEPVGVHLQVVPQIMDNRYINIIIRPAVTSLGSAVQGTTGLSINRINTTEANTQAIVRSGETVVIGGLIRDRIENEITKLPLLGSLPIIGWAFKHKRNAVEKVNLMVFVTPTIVEREQ
jgi:type II secretory pathway component HofQ